MISSWADAVTYVKADLSRCRGGALRCLVAEPQLRWLLRLRLTEWWCNTRPGPVAAVLRWRLAAAGARIGYSIPINRLGAGVRLPHVGTIAINGECTVGSHCQILPDVVLGGNDQGAPRIGNGVFIGPGVKVIGDVSVGDRAVLAAGAVVVHDVPAGEVWASPRAHRVGNTTADQEAPALEPEDRAGAQRPRSSSS